MTRHTALIATAAAVFLTACDQAGGGWDDLFDTADTNDTSTFYNQDPLIAQLDYGCNSGNPDTWWFASYNEGWAGDMTIDIYETGDGNWPSNPGAVWDETHHMNNVEWAQDGSWDRWDLNLRDVESIGAQVNGSTTLFSCRWDDGRSLAFKATLFDDNGPAKDCAIWGHESQQYYNDYRNNSCICFDPDGTCSN